MIDGLAVSHQFHFPADGIIFDYIFDYIWRLSFELRLFPCGPGPGPGRDTDTDTDTGPGLEEGRCHMATDPKKS